MAVIRRLRPLLCPGRRHAADRRGLTPAGASALPQGGTQGRVRTWMALADAGVALFNMRGNRWCNNVGRQHKSNGIFYVVDLEQGVRRRQ
jgi:hypothetical protein